MPAAPAASVSSSMPGPRPPQLRRGGRTDAGDRDLPLGPVGAPHQCARQGVGPPATDPNSRRAIAELWLGTKQKLWY